MMAIVILVNVTVFSRFVIRVSLQGYEELPPLLLIVMVWLGTILVARSDEMLKVEIFQAMIKPAKARQAVQLFCLVISAVILAYFIPLTYGFLATCLERNLRSPAAGFPMWWVHGSLLVGTVGMFIYYCVLIIKAARRMMK